MPEARPYRLSIAPALEPFRPEIEYAAAFLDRCHLVELRADAATVLHYGPEPPAGAIAVPAALFPHGVRTDNEGLHPSPDGLARIERANGGAGLLPPTRAAGGSPIEFKNLRIRELP